eukprot:CAMPEP_0117657112 /NCGR_PEP_ID=MMETSP0804-20121206/5159_1 /TAXON_ID=1074897 /ORGANISM="Tetraselmis astigmatica, Strain CCMP880" /LENGTH=709 /DNA_ID=CAMNT_0005463549 /DNA_START=405 /DNA_END=2531 /DNA_ORIENTATION=+
MRFRNYTAWCMLLCCLLFATPLTLSGKELGGTLRSPSSAQQQLASTSNIMQLESLNTEEDSGKPRLLSQWEATRKSTIDAVNSLIDGFFPNKPIGPLLPAHETNTTLIESHHHTHHPLIHPGSLSNAEGTYHIPQVPRMASPAPGAAPRPNGPYSVIGQGFGLKKLLQSKFEPASSCGPKSPVAFRSRFPVPHARKCIKAYNDVPVLAILLANPTAAVRQQITTLKGSFAAEWMALWDAASLQTHNQAAFNAQWQKTLNGPNDFLVYTKQQIGQPDLADRLLKSTAARLALLSMDAENELPRVTLDWINSAADLFAQHPRLAVIGMAAGKTSSGFSFTMDAGAGPWLVRRDTLMESGAAGFVEFCVDTCPLSEGLAALAWTGGFQAGQLGEKAAGWPIAPAHTSKGSLLHCIQMGAIAVDQAAVSAAAREAQAAFEQGLSTENALAVKKACGTYQVLTEVARSTPAACGKSGGPDVKASILIQYFKRPGIIKTLLGALNVKLETEVLINNDSQTDHDAWLSRMSPNSFLFHSPNVHEIRGYNRLARFARGEIIVMMQDDDQPKPGDATWLIQGRDLFKIHKGLGMVGGLRGRMDVGKGVDKETNQNAGKKYGPRFLKIYQRCPKLKIPFMFMYKVNAAPLLARRQVMMQLGGLQEAFSCPGDAGIGFDFEYSIRLWAAGYQVGLYDPRFNRPQPGKRGKAGTRVDDKKW